MIGEGVLLVVVGGAVGPQAVALVPVPSLDPNPGQGALLPPLSHGSTTNMKGITLGELKYIQAQTLAVKITCPSWFACDGNDDEVSPNCCLHGVILFDQSPVRVVPRGYEPPRPTWKSKAGGVYLPMAETNKKYDLR